MSKMGQKWVKNVIIMTSLPRYDPTEVDPHSIKAKLNNFGNSIYTSLWMQKGCPKNLMIYDQNLECNGGLRQKRFGSPGIVDKNGKPWDGIHMRGRLAVTHYTDSIIRILSGTAALPVHLSKSKSNFHKSCPQTLYQQGYQRNNRKDDRNQSRVGNNYTHGQTWKKSNNYGHRNQGNSQHYGSNVRVSNRFETLGN